MYIRTRIRILIRILVRIMVRIYTFNVYLSSPCFRPKSVPLERQMGFWAAIRYRLLSVPDVALCTRMLLNQVNDGMVRARDNELRQSGVTAIQAGVMFVLKAMNGEATPTEISRWLFREPQTVSQLLVRMEKQGLVRRIRRRNRNPDDGTLVRILLTQKGERVFQQQNVNRKAIGRIVSGLSVEQRRTFRECLEILRERTLEELTVRPQLPFP